MRWYHRYELEHLLARAGFEIVALYGGFDRRPFDRDAKEMIFVCRAYSVPAVRLTRRLHGLEAQPDVVRGPLPDGVAQRRRERVAHLGEVRRDARRPAAAP